MKTGLITGDLSVDPHRGRSGAAAASPDGKRSVVGGSKETESRSSPVSSGRCPLQASAPLPTYPSTSRSNSTGLFTARSERHARISSGTAQPKNHKCGRQDQGHVRKGITGRTRSLPTALRSPAPPMDGSRWVAGMAASLTLSRPQGGGGGEVLRNAGREAGREEPRIQSRFRCLIPGCSTHAQRSRGSLCLADLAWLTRRRRLLVPFCLCDAPARRVDKTCNCPPVSSSTRLWS
jgi:hypothetical protein